MCKAKPYSSMGSAVSQVEAPERVPGSFESGGWIALDVLGMCFACWILLLIFCLSWVAVIKLVVLIDDLVNK